jgi:hypothetical protein
LGGCFDLKKNTPRSKSGTNRIEASLCWELSTYTRMDV